MSPPYFSYFPVDRKSKGELDTLKSSNRVNVNGGASGILSHDNVRVKSRQCDVISDKHKLLKVIRHLKRGECGLEGMVKWITPIGIISWFAVITGSIVSMAAIHQEMVYARPLWTQIAFLGILVTGISAIYIAFVRK